MRGSAPVGSSTLYKGLSPLTASFISNTTPLIAPFDPAEQGDAMLDAGVTLLTIGLNGPDYDMSKVKSWIDWRNERALG
jgi:hypothetical protein